MADLNLKTAYKDDVLDTKQNTKRKFHMIQNEDGTVSFEDVTVYLQVGDSFGAADVNVITEALNEVSSNMDTKLSYIRDLTSADADLNNIRNIGVYRVNTDTITKLANAPYDNACFIEVLSNKTGTRILQRATRYGEENHSAYRTYVSDDGGWRQWTYYATKKDIDSHTHKYAASSTVGGSATSAVKLDSSAGSENVPVYFKNGKPVACSSSMFNDGYDDIAAGDAILLNYNGAMIGTTNTGNFIVLGFCQSGNTAEEVGTMIYAHIESNMSNSYIETILKGTNSIAPTVYLSSNGNLKLKSNHTKTCRYRYVVIKLS